MLWKIRRLFYTFRIKLLFVATITFGKVFFVFWPFQKYLLFLLSFNTIYFQFFSASNNTDKWGRAYVPKGKVFRKLSIKVFDFKGSPDLFHFNCTSLNPCCHIPFMHACVAFWNYLTWSLQTMNQHKHFQNARQWGKQMHKRIIINSC